MPPEDRIRILHMIEAAQTAVGFVADRVRGDLDSDRMLVLALVRAIEIVGEAANRVGMGTRESLPEIPWTLIISMRNRLIHAYFDIDHEIVWKTATEELPRLLPSLQAALAGDRGK